MNFFPCIFTSEFSIISICGLKYSGKTSIINPILLRTNYNFLNREQIFCLLLFLFENELSFKNIRENFFENTVFIENNKIFIGRKNEVKFQDEKSYEEIFNKNYKKDVPVEILMDFIEKNLPKILRSRKNLIVENFILSRNIFLIERNKNLRASHFFRDKLFFSIEEIRKIFAAEDKFIINGKHKIFIIFNNNFIEEPIAAIFLLLKKLKFYF